MSIVAALLLTVVSELTITEGKLEEFLALVMSELDSSRRFQGNLSFDIYTENESSSKVLFVEEWETEEDFQAYYLWRLERGDFALLGTFFSAPPVMRKFTNVSGNSESD